MKQVKFRCPVRLLALICGLFMTATAFAQQIAVNGFVKDATGEPIIGATVRVAGVEGGTVTDLDGNFTLNVNPGAKLQISYIGYATQEVTAAKNVVVTLQEDAGQNLNEVVVIGYGVARKTDLTGSVVAMKPDEKNHGIITSAQDMIAGKIAGVNINTSNGEPGGGAQIRIRGGASLNASNNPLIVIDGMPMDGNSTKGMSNPLSLINPNDIESFTVLKDASATAIYGSRGSNGVIIITTKKGRKNQAPKVTYNGTISISQVAKKLDVMNAGEYVNFIKNYYGEDSDAYRGLGWKEYNVDGTPNYEAGTYDTDWQDRIYRDAVSTDHNISVSGGVGNESWSMPYRVSVGYTFQEGVLKKSSYGRFTTGFSLNPSLLDDHLTMNINGKYTFTKAHSGGQDAIGAATRMDPTRPISSNESQFENWGGYWQWVKATDAYDSTFPYDRNADAPMNPVERVVHNKDNRKTNIILGNFEADYKIHGFEDLRLHMNLSGMYSKGGEYTHYGPYNTYAYYFGNDGENTEKKYNLTASAYAQYFKDFKDIHHLDVTAGYEYSKMKYWGNSWYKNYYPATSDKAGQINHEEATPWAGQVILVSWYGRANYTLLDRYLFTFTGRYDGSSRFKHGKQWGFFPAAAVAWRIKDETFLKDVDPISDLKLRLSWGKTGQQDTGKEYYTPTYKVSTTNDHLYPVGPDNPGYLYKPLVYNDDLTWETTTTWNAGIDFGMFNQRLTLTLDGYIRKTTDLLCTPTIPAGQNFDNAMLLNAGSLKNTGFEVAITGRPIQSNDWFVEISANAAYNKNKITELYGGRDMIEAGMQVGTNEAITYHKVGKPANSFWVYQQVYDENGRPVQGVYVDRNADGSIDANDRYFYKNIAAPWTGGFALKVGYKNWDLGTNFRVSLGNYVYNDIEQGKINTSVLYNASKNYYDNSTQKIVSLGWDSYNYSLSDYFVQNASFLKCDNITLGYNFANVWKSNTYGGLSGRIYASCSNVFTWTKYPGLDPEQPGGKETSVYPRSRTFLLGLNLNF